MTNYALIINAAKLVAEIEEAEGITETQETIINRARGWYNNTEITSAEMLAAATLNGSYDPSISWDTLVEWTKYYFYDPEDIRWSMPHFSVGEIEDSYRDYLWR